MYDTISRNIHLFRDKEGLSFCQLSKRIEKDYQIHLSPIDLKLFEEGQEMSVSDLFHISLGLRVSIAELFEENPILD